MPCVHGPTGAVPLWVLWSPRRSSCTCSVGRCQSPIPVAHRPPGRSFSCAPWAGVYLRAAAAPCGACRGMTARAGRSAGCARRLAAVCGVRRGGGSPQRHPAEGLAHLLHHIEAGQELRAPVADDLPDLVPGAAHEKMWSMRYTHCCLSSLATCR